VKQTGRLRCRPRWFRRERGADKEAIDTECWSRPIIDRAKSGTIEPGKATSGPHPEIAIAILQESLNDILREAVLRAPYGTCEVCCLSGTC